MIKIKKVYKSHPFYINIKMENKIIDQIIIGGRIKVCIEESLMPYIFRTKNSIDRVMLNILVEDTKACNTSKFFGSNKKRELCRAKKGYNFKIEDAKCTIGNKIKGYAKIPNLGTIPFEI